METLPHINKPQAELIDYYLDKLIKAYNPRRVFVIGSVATGKAHSRSDIDFVVDSGDSHIDPDAVVGAIDIIPYHTMPEYIKQSLQREGVLIYEQN